jgi:hypothetical protein
VGYLVSFLGVIGALFVMGVSATMNARYAMSLGREPFDQMLLAGGALFADGGKALAWIFFASALARKQRLAALASLLIFVLCLGIAAAGSLGFVALQRAQSTGVIETKTDTLKDLRAEKQRKEEQLSLLAVSEPADVIAKRIAGLKQDWRYSSSRQCGDATASASRKFCTDLANTEADEKKALSAARLEQEISVLRGQMEGLGSVARMGKSDVQSELISKVTGWKLWDVQLWLQLLFVAMIEAGACFMLFAAMNHGQSTLASTRALRAERDERRAKPLELAASSHGLPEPVVDDALDVTPSNSNGPIAIEATANDDHPQPARSEPVMTPSHGTSNNTSITDERQDRHHDNSSGKPDTGKIVTLPTAAVRAAARPTGDVTAFIKAMFEFVDEGEAIIEQSSIFDHYRAWCTATDCDAQDEPTFGKLFGLVCEKAEITRKKHGTEFYVLGVVLKSLPRRGRARRPDRSAAR